jgi:hypothetical protein
LGDINDIESHTLFAMIGEPDESVEDIARLALRQLHNPFSAGGRHDRDIACVPETEDEFGVWRHSVRGQHEQILPSPFNVLYRCSGRRPSNAVWPRGSSQDALPVLRPQAPPPQLRS